jgi:hypothetical protein
MGGFEVLVAAFAVTMVFSIPFAVFAYVRYLRYKETIALAERGLLRPERTRRNRDTLRWGIIIMMIGLGLVCGLWPLGFMASGPAIDTGERAAAPERVNPAEPVNPEAPVRPNFPEGPVMIDESGGDGLPFGIGPWMVLGILPFFFGLSLVIIHWVNKREETAEGDEQTIPAHKQVD